MYHKIFLAFAFVLLLSCEKDTRNACENEDPFDAEWLDNWKQNLQKCYCEFTINQALYGGTTVFYINMTDLECDTAFVLNLYDCDGYFIRKLGLDYSYMLTEVDTLYICEATKDQ